MNAAVNAKKETFLIVEEENMLERLATQWVLAFFVRNEVIVKSEQII